jgi:hypothetical protein
MDDEAGIIVIYGRTGLLLHGHLHRELRTDKLVQYLELDVRLIRGPGSATFGGEGDVRLPILPDLEHDPHITYLGVHHQV